MLKPRFWSSAALLCVLALAIGCGNKDPFSYVKVKGTATYEDGTPITAHRVKVTFYPQAPPKDEKTHPRPGVAYVAPDGTFSDITSHKPNDGIVPGEHKVTVEAFDEQDQPLAIIAPEFTDMDKTPLRYDTNAGGPAEFKVKKK